MIHRKVYENDGSLKKHMIELSWGEQQMLGELIECYKTLPLANTEDISTDDDCAVSGVLIQDNLETGTTFGMPYVVADIYLANGADFFVRTLAFMRQLMESHKP